MDDGIPRQTQEEIISYWQNKVKRGFLSLIILRKFQDLDEQGSPIILNGQRIKEEIYEQTKKKWAPSPGSIYPILSVMEKHGIISIVDSQNKKNKQYRITPFGRQLYKILMEEALIFRKHQKGYGYLNLDDKIELRQHYSKMSLKDIKHEYEYLKELIVFLEEYLKERIITDKSIS